MKSSTTKSLVECKHAEQVRKIDQRIEKLSIFIRDLQRNQRRWERRRHLVQYE